MWAIMSGLGRWMHQEEVLQTIIHVEDGERACELVGLFGCAFLTALDCVDKAGKLTKDSELRNLGLVMSIYLSWSFDLEDYGIEGECVEWRKSVIAYAKRADIDLEATGYHSVQKVLPKYSSVKALKDETRRRTGGAGRRL